MDKSPTGASLVSCFGEPRITGKIAVYFFSLTLLLYIDLAFCLNYEWNNLMKRLMTLKELAFAIFCTGGYFAHLNMATVENEYILKYLKLVDESNHSSAKRKILNETNEFIKRLCRISNRSFTTVFFVVTGPPFVSFLIELTKAQLAERPMRAMPSTMHVYIPQAFRTTVGYSLIQIATCSWYGIILYIWSIVFKIFVIGLACLCTEMELLFESVNELDALSSVDENNNLSSTSGNTEDVKRINELRLRRKFNSIIEYHQNITRSMKLFNRMYQSTMILFLNVYSTQICLYIIFMLKLKEVALRVKFGLLYLFALYIQYQYASWSQRIKDRGETFGSTLYECNWVDKPQWMKKMLLIMKCMADQPMVIKPYGLYVVDRRFMANIVKATYTYVNVVNEFFN